MQRLDAPIRGYAWGSRTAIAALQGRPASGGPEAELWMGAHPGAPAVLAGTGEPLDAAIAADPDGWLGADVAAEFGPRLPFLLKVLAAAEPLSLQAHPSTEQAVAGFDAEEASGVERRRNLQQKRSAALLLHIALHRHDLFQILTPDIDAVEPAGHAEQHKYGNGRGSDDARG